MGRRALGLPPRAPTPAIPPRGVRLRPPTDHASVAHLPPNASDSATPNASKSPLAVAARAAAPAPSTAPSDAPDVLLPRTAIATTDQPQRSRSLEPRSHPPSYDASDCDGNPRPQESALILDLATIDKPQLSLFADQTCLTF